MKVHEYQAKEIFARYGISVPRGKVATTPEEVEAIAKEFDVPVVVVKAQIHAGGRGKGGGVKLAKSPEEAKTVGGEILGMNLVTHQTGPEGQKVKKVLVEEGSKIAKELYLGMVLDRAEKVPCVMVSTEGGMDIEEVAANTPEKIVKVHLHPSTGLAPYHGRKLAKALGLSKPLAKQFNKFLAALYEIWLKEDTSLVEINPLVITEDDELFALDGKVNFDENAMYRHKDIAELRDFDEEDPVEVEAGEAGLSYVNLEGNVGCMVNGAGLAMATMDIIKYAGGQPANFLDVGGGANADTVEKAFRIILKDPNVKAILINIFGGIVRCDRVANGVIQAASNVDLKVPLVVRLRGTNAVEAKEILEKSDFDFEVADELADAAKKVVAAAKRAEG